LNVGVRLRARLPIRLRFVARIFFSSNGNGATQPYAVQSESTRSHGDSMNNGIATRAGEALKTVAALIGAAAALTACGGGGGLEAEAPSAISPPLSVNVHAAYQNLVRQPHLFSLTGTTSLGIDVTAQLAVSQGPRYVAYGTTVDSATISALIYSGGTLRTIGSTSAWQEIGSPNWLITFSSADGTCTLRTGGVPLPSAASLGDSGPYLSGTQYPGCTASNLPTTSWIPSATVTQTWSYSLISALPFVCIHTSTRTLIGTATESDCVEVVDSNGTLGSRMRIAMKDLNGVTTTLSN